MEERRARTEPRLGGRLGRQVAPGHVGATDGDVIREAKPKALAEILGLDTPLIHPEEVVAAVALGCGAMHHTADAVEATAAEAGAIRLEVATVEPRQVEQRIERRRRAKGQGVGQSTETAIPADRRLDHLR